ncbi:MAG: DUF4286 family protein [Paramuribaculum sp.]|nr:DUF4286 family protein [Paramuribaculum sp.]
MILANITFAVSAEVDAYFIDWAKNTFVKEAVEKGEFTSPLLCRIKSNDVDCASSYAIQFRHRSDAEAHDWYERRNGAELLTRLVQKFGDKILWFITFMDIID